MEGNASRVSSGKCTGVFRINNITKISVGSSHRSWNIHAEIVHTCSVSLYLPINEGCVCSFCLHARYLAVFLFFQANWALKNNRTSGRATEISPFVNGSTGAHETRAQNVYIHPAQMSLTFGLLC